MPAYKPGIEGRAMNVIGDDGWMFMITGRAVVFGRVERTSINILLFKSKDKIMDC